jgi:hypothetical protein
LPRVPIPRKRGFTGAYSTYGAKVHHFVFVRSIRTFYVCFMFALWFLTSSSMILSISIVARF